MSRAHLLLLAALFATRGEAAGPVFSSDGPALEEHGAAQGYPIGDPRSFMKLPFLVGSHSHLDQIFPSHAVPRAAMPSALARAPEEPEIRYKASGEQRTLDDYLARNPTTGLLIARGDTILVERYRYDRKDTDRFTSWSMAKTMTGMLVGLALDEGLIKSLDDPAETYVPALSGSAYGATALRHLLTMSSGVAFREDYTGDDDVAILGRETFAPNGAGGLAAVQRFNHRTAPGGFVFSYASSESEVLGLVVQQVTGKSLAAYFTEKIWQPLGAEADAAWLIDSQGAELGYCCFNAVLRDYARLGLLMAHDGNWRGRQLVPRQWVVEATTVPASETHRKPEAGRRYGYGYQVWIMSGPRRQFAFLGVRGQAIFVDPAAKLVLVHTAVRRDARDPVGGAELAALWRAVVERFSE